MPSESIVDSRLFIRLDLSNANLVNQAFAENLFNKAHFASQILLYETIIIPTTDYGIIPIIISWVGQDNFIKILKAGGIQFIRRNSMLAYNGGLGIGLNMLENGNSKSFPWWLEAQYCDDEKALMLQRENMLPSLSTQKSFIKQVLDHTTHLSFENDFFMKHIVDESYKDIISSPSLLALVQKYGKKRQDGTIHLERLEEVPTNSTRVLSQDGKLNDIADLVLRVAEINMELAMSLQTGDADLFTSQGAEKILHQKVYRAKIPQGLSDGFSKLLDLNNIPDIRSAIVNNAIEMSNILAIRESSKGKKFRNWLREANVHYARDLERAYVEALGKNTLADSIPLRSMRFTITFLTGLANPAIGLGIDIVDSFFIDNWLKGFTPKLFLDELQTLSISKKK